MCVMPTYIWVLRGPSYEKQETVCRKCWRCRKNRVNDYVGRCLAEASLSDWTRTITLTYAPGEGGALRDDLAEKVLTIKHFQDCIRALRKRGHVLRYLAAGEYGSLNGRAHFHACLFGKGKPPQLPLQQNVHADWWPHGFIYVDGNADERSIRYVCKYLLKDGDQGWTTMSKKPHLGALWFTAKAQRDAGLGVMPSSFRYTPPGGSKDRSYIMTGTTRREYLRDLLDALGRPKNRQVLTEWAETSIQKVLRWEHMQTAHYPPEAEFIQAFKAELEKRGADYWRHNPIDEEKTLAKQKIIRKGSGY